MIAFTTKRYPWCPTIPSTIKVPFFFFFFWFIDPLYACKQPNYYEILTKLSDEVPYNILTSGQLKKEYILLNLFCKYNMMPTNITSTVIVRDALIYSWILEGKHFVLVALLCYSAVASLTNASKFLQWLSNTVATLVVPSLVMPLCLTHDVPVLPLIRCTRLGVLFLIVLYTEACPLPMFKWLRLFIFLHPH